MPRGPYKAPRLSALLADPKVLKLFHFGRFDIAVLEHALGVRCEPVYCTKIAAKLVRTFTDRYGLKDLCRDLLGVDLSKQQQTSDWGAETLTDEQMTYAASDVLHLHALRAKLDAMLVREGRTELAQAAFTFLPTRRDSISPAGRTRISSRTRHISPVWHNFCSMILLWKVSMAFRVGVHAYRSRV